MQFSPFIDAGEAYDADIEVQSSVAAALSHPSVSMVFPPSPSSSQYVVSPPTLSTSYCVTMASPTTSHPFISSEESSEDEFCITPTFHTIQGHGHGQRRKLPRCQHDLEILVDLEAELVVEVEAWEGDIVGMFHFLLLVHLLQLRSIKC